MSSQNERLLAYLETGAAITNLESWRILGIYALSQRIGELKRDGHPIIKRTVTVHSPFGTTCRVAEYRLVQP
jgi:hypothetical protein